MDESLFVTKDLGDVNEPLLICGGAYGNLEALEALLERADEMGFATDCIIHTGDVAAYCANPSETAELLRSSGVRAIQGNVEDSLWSGALGCGCGFDQESQCHVLSQRWFAHADKSIGEEVRSWMGSLPHHLVLTMAGRTVRVVHGGVSSINEFIFASAETRRLEEELDNAGAEIVIAGHSGVPFTRLLGRRAWHNSGALGMPANDGTDRVWFSTITPNDGQILFEHHALSYNFGLTRQKMLAAGLPDSYANALAKGHWPSLDILPALERSQTGIPISLDRCVLK